MSVRQVPLELSAVQQLLENNSFPGVNNSNYANAGTGVGSRPVNQPQAQAPTPSASNYSGIQRPKPVESNVKPVEINIPDFLKNPRR